MTTQSPSPPSATPPITQMRTTTPALRHHTKPAQQHSTTSATSNNTPLPINADIIWTISPAALAAANPALYAKLIETLKHNPNSNNNHNQSLTPALRWQIRAHSTTAAKPTVTAQPQLILISNHQNAVTSAIPKSSAAIDLAEPLPLKSALPTPTTSSHSHRTTK